MENKTRVLKAYFYRLFTTPALYISIAGIAAFACFSRFGADKSNVLGEVVGNFDALLNIDAMRKTIVIFGAVPFAANFAEEWNSAVTTSVVSRCGVRRYTLSNILCVFISSVIAVFLGLMLFTGIASALTDNFFFPPSPNVTVEKPFALFLRNGLPLLYIVYKSFVLALSCGAWSVAGLAVSAFFPNKYVAICAPLVVSYLLERITFYLPMPLCVVVVQNSDLQFESLWWQLLYSFGFFAALAALGGALFSVIVKRRVQNELS